MKQPGVPLVGVLLAFQDASLAIHSIGARLLRLSARAYIFLQSPDGTSELSIVRKLTCVLYE